MAHYNATALVLHRTDLGENDRILTLFTRERGKLGVVAKGSRKGTSRLSGATELFMTLRLQLAEARNLDIITQCEIVDTHSPLRLNLDLLARATYLCELLDRTTEERDTLTSEELFDLTLTALTLLAKTTTYPDGVLHAYELRLLEAIGYAPVLDHCVKTGEPLERRTVGFSPSLGGTVGASERYQVQDALPLSQESLHLMQTFANDEPERLLALTPSPKAAAEVAKALRWYIRFRINRALRSAEFLDQIRAAV